MKIISLFVLSFFGSFVLLPSSPPLKGPKQDQPRPAHTDSQPASHNGNKRPIVVAGCHPPPPYRPFDSAQSGRFTTTTAIPPPPPRRPCQPRTKIRVFF